MNSCTLLFELSLLRPKPNGVGCLGTSRGRQALEREAGARCGTAAAAASKQASSSSSSSSSQRGDVFMYAAEEDNAVEIGRVRPQSV